MRARMIHDIAGRFHDNDDGAKSGEMVDIEPEIYAWRYIACGICDFADESTTPEVNKVPI